MAKKSKAARLVTEWDGWEDRELKELVAIVQEPMETCRTLRRMAPALRSVKARWS